MANWASKLWRTISRASAAADRAREAMRAAQRDRTPVVLQPPTSPTMAVIAMNTTIEQVRSTDMVIAQPTLEGSTRQLVSGESLRLSFILQPYGQVSAVTHVLGRLKLSGTDDKPFYGYRMAIPEVILKADRRRSERATIGFEISRESEIYKLNDQVPIRGVVQNVSTTGMQVRTHNRPNLTRGERVRLVVYLPPPVGEVNRMVSVARVTCDSNPRFRLVGLAFERELPGLGELIEQLKGKRETMKRRKAG